MEFFEFKDFLNLLNMINIIYKECYALCIDWFLYLNFILLKLILIY